MTDYKALCAELVHGWTEGRDIAGPMANARTALAQPEPEGPTDEEILQIAAATSSYESCGIAIGEYEAETECVVEVYGSELIAFARAALTRWGRPAIEPEGVTDEELLGLDDLRDAWNAQADAANSWDELGIDEIIWFAQQQALARWGRHTLPLPTP